VASSGWTRAIAGRVANLWLLLGVLEEESFDAWRDVGCDIPVLSLLSSQSSVYYCPKGF
jgi:hypothetical protein